MPHMNQATCESTGESQGPDLVGKEAVSPGEGRTAGTESGDRNSLCIWCY